MSLPGITFNGKHSLNDYGLIMNFFKVQPPVPKKTKSSVPFMHGSYDFSTIATNGEKVYEERNIQIGFTIMADSKTNLYERFSSVLLWLLESPQSRLITDYQKDIYYLAEIEEAPSWDEVNEIGEFTVTFKAEPFKYSKTEVGQEEWDTVNFDTFIFQDTAFNVVGNKTVILKNDGRVICPEVFVNSNISCTINGYTTNFTPTRRKDFRFKLLTGNNTIVINGTGTIEFKFRRQVI